MSETSAAVVTAPTEAPTGTAEPTPVQDGAAAALPDTPKYLTRQEAKRSLFPDRHAADAAPTETTEPSTSAGVETVDSPSVDPVLDAQGRKHDPATGKFLGEDPNAPAATPPVDETVDAPAAPPQAGIRIDIPNDHPLRNSGLDAFTASTAEEERGIRALLNSYTRRAEVEQLNQENLRLKAQIAARDQFVSQPLMDAQTAAQIEAIREVDPALAERLESAANLERQMALSQAEQQALSQIEQQFAQTEVQHAAAAWAEQTLQSNIARLPAEVVALPDFQQTFADELIEFDAILARRAEMGLQLDMSALDGEFAQRLNARLWRNPQVQALGAQAQRAKQQAEADRLKREADATAAERERQRLQEATQRTATRAGHIPSVVRTDKHSVDLTPSMENVPAHDRKRFIKGQLFGSTR